MEIDISKYEPTISAIAHNYSSLRFEQEDLEQEGRIGALMAFRKKPDGHKGYVRKAIENEMITYIKSQNAQMRTPREGSVSINDSLNHDRGFSIEDTLGKEDPPIPEEATGNAIEELKRKYGEHYMKKILFEKRPERIVRRLINIIVKDILGIPPQEIPSTCDDAFFEENHLSPFLEGFYNGCAFDAVSDVFRKDFLLLDYSSVPSDFFVGKLGYKRAVRAVEWFAGRRGINEIEDCRHIDWNDFEEEGLTGKFGNHFNRSPPLALKTKFPGLQLWQTATTQKGFFDDEDNQLNATLSFLLDNGIPSILELSPEETYETGIKGVVSKRSMRNSGLRSLLEKFNENIYNLYSNLFPEQILPWTLSGLTGPWKKKPRETASKAIRWLFNDYLQIPLEEIPKYATYDLLWQVGFSGIMTRKSIDFRASSFLAINSAYPGVFSKEDFHKNRKISKIHPDELRRRCNTKIQYSLIA